MAKKSKHEKVRKECLKRIETEGFVPMVLEESLNFQLFSDSEEEGLLVYKGVGIFIMSLTQWLTMLEKLVTKSRLETEVYVYDEAIQEEVDNSNPYNVVGPALNQLVDNTLQKLSDHGVEDCDDPECDFCSEEDDGL